MATLIGTGSHGRDIRASLTWQRVTGGQTIIPHHDDYVNDGRAIWIGVNDPQRRAELIARDQSNKANAVVNRARQMELGITEAIWMHSHAGKTPRPDHFKANGTVYKIAEGCKISGEYIQPGEEINCRCTSRPVLPF